MITELTKEKTTYPPTPPPPNNNLRWPFSHHLLSVVFIVRRVWYLPNMWHFRQGNPKWFKGSFSILLDIHSRQTYGTKYQRRTLQFADLLFCRLWKKNKKNTMCKYKKCIKLKVTQSKYYLYLLTHILGIILRQNTFTRSTNVLRRITHFSDLFFWMELHFFYEMDFKFIIYKFEL